MQIAFKQSLLGSCVFQFLLNSHSFYYHKLLKRPWLLLWNKSYALFRDYIVCVPIHQVRCKVNYGYSYCLFSRRFPYYNNPLLELAYLTRKLKGKRITFVDVGAACGDTVLFLDKNIPELFQEIYCVDGDEQFVSFLNYNLRNLPNKKIIATLLSSEDQSSIQSLVRTHPGTATAEGEQQVITRSLDGLFLDLDELDLIKIDVDGYDGEVLKGAQGILQKHRPAIIFEWHPIHLERTGNAHFAAFDALKLHGYTRTIWFDKFGVFFEFNLDRDFDRIKHLINESLSKPAMDIHYDVVALHEYSPLNENEISECLFSKNKPSPY